MIFSNKRGKRDNFVGIDEDVWDELDYPILEIMMGLRPIPVNTNKYKLLLPKEMVLWGNTQE